MEIVGIIPARLESTRLPRKLLLEETGKPLIQHTWEAASRGNLLDRLYIATDSEEIAQTVTQFGGDVLMTGDCPSGTDRLAAAIKTLEKQGDLPQILVNIQGDEPEVNAAHLDLLVDSLKSHPNVEMATLATPILTAEQLNDPSCVKVVCAANGEALYFSRSAIPYLREGSVDQIFSESSAPTPWLMHVGLYAYRREFLQAFAEMPVSTLESLEKLEQLRALEAGAKIQVEIVAQHSVGIDTPEDYAAFIKRNTG